MSAMLREFREFAMRGNVVDMAVGIIMGSAFGAIARSLVDDVLMPPLGLLVGGINFSNLYLVLKPGAQPGPYATLAEAKAAGAVTLGYGAFVNTVASFVIVAFAVFVLIRAVNALRREHETPAPEAAPATKACPYCVSSIPAKAVRCPQCTSALEA